MPETTIAIITLFIYIGSYFTCYIKKECGSGRRPKYYG